MSKIVHFPATSVLDWYSEAELMLTDFLKYVPYCDAHEGVWSPKLVIVLQETCSQIDSLWRWEAVNLYQRNSDVDIKDYFALYGAQIAPRWVVFWSEEPKKVQPFSEWQDITSYKPLDWWKEGYQKVKHSRLENRACSSLKRTVEALAGLFLAIIHSQNCWDSLWEKHWMSWDDSGGTPFNPLDCLKEDFGSLNNQNRCGVMHMAIESELFTYPVGLCNGLIKADKSFPHWKGSCSHRFKAWYYNYCQNVKST